MILFNVFTATIYVDQPPEHLRGHRSFASTANIKQTANFVCFLPLWQRATSAARRTGPPPAFFGIPEIRFPY
jgi:hypothetical protein